MECSGKSFIGTAAADESMNIDRDKRVKDFRRRADYSPHSVSRHRIKGWEYIPVHHFADEVDTSVAVVDCWCLLGADAALLECSVGEGSPLPSGLYVRIDAESPHWIKLHAVLPGPLTRAAVERAMESFAALGFPDALSAVLQPGGSLIRLKE